MTTPSFVFTWICVDFTSVALSSSALTFAVIALSSTFWPTDVSVLPDDIVELAKHYDRYG